MDRRNTSGFSMVELIVAMAIFGVVLASMFSVYTTVLKQNTTTRKMVKTETDIVNTVWPLFKELETTGFGNPAVADGTPSGACIPANGINPITWTGGVLTIHSTTSGEQKESGRWSIIAADGKCTVDGLKGLATGEKVVIINGSNRKMVNTTTYDDSSQTLAGCNSDAWKNMFAYWAPSKGTLQCYETSFQRQNYTSLIPKPNMCASGTGRIARKVAYTVGGSTASFQPVIDCVGYLSFRFGCINDLGALTWRTDQACDVAEGKLRLLRVGIVVQESPRTSLQGATKITMFDDTPSAEDFNLSNEQRYYKWKKAERTLVLRNLE